MTSGIKILKSEQVNYIYNGLAHTEELTNFVVFLYPRTCPECVALQSMLLQIEKELTVDEESKFYFCSFQFETADEPHALVQKLTPDDHSCLLVIPINKGIRKKVAILPDPDPIPETWEEAYEIVKKFIIKESL